MRVAAACLLCAVGAAGHAQGVVEAPLGLNLRDSRIGSPDQTILTQRATFLAAERALERGKTQRFDALAAALTSYVLHPYLIALRFQRHGHSGEVFETTQAALEDTPLMKETERRWLRRLAARQRWGDFLTYYSPSGAADLRCLHARALLVQGRREEAFAVAKPLWLIGRSQHKACDPVFFAWRKAGLPVSLVQERLALAFKRGNRTLVRYLRRLLPTGQRDLANAWLDLRNVPLRARKYAARPLKGLDPILTASVRRWAYQAPDEAIALWRDVAAKRDSLNPNALAAHFGALLFRRQRHIEAEPWLRAARPGDITARMAEIRIFNRIALGQWSEAEVMIGALPSEVQGAEQWVYWRGRIAQAQGSGEMAKGLWRPLANERSYYGYLAAERLEQPYRFNDTAIASDAAVLEKLRGTRTFQRAKELQALGRIAGFRREWRWLERAFPGHLGELAVLAHAEGWRSTAILTLARAGEFDALAIRFPVLFEPQLREQSEALELSVHWLLATIRQESAFISDARSHAGAIGLMQIMPATGRYLARRHGVRPFDPKRLVEPSLNIALGTRYLRQLLDEFGHPLLASAAYNAGPHRIRRWLPDNPMSADLWVETIPFKETRTYVKRIAYYRIIYARQLGETPARLGQVFTDIRRMPG